MNFYYHWTTVAAWRAIRQSGGLKLSRSVRRVSAIGLSYKVQGGKIWLCDIRSRDKFQDHIAKIKGVRPTVLLRVYINPKVLIPFRPMPGAYFVRFPIPIPFIELIDN